MPYCNRRKVVRDLQHHSVEAFTNMPITPYTGPFGRPELLHLLRRSLFGVSPTDLAHFQGQTLDQVIDELLTFTNDTAPPVKAYADVNSDPNGLDAIVPFGETWVNTPRNPSDDSDVISARLESWAGWWMGLMVEQQRNLREKLTLFWHNHLPTQVGVVFHSEASYTLNQVLRTQCGGNFRSLIHDVSLEPAMLYYLNGYLNVADSPDENYGRELLELFMLGQGSGYTEADVQAAARVLTGWTVLEENGGNPALPQAIFFPFNHTQTDKQFSAFFNNTVITGEAGSDAGENELNALLDMVLATPTCSRFICREIYRFFLHGEVAADAEAEVIEPLSQLFRDNQGAPDQILIVMRALLTSEYFFNDQIRGCMIKNPTDLVVGDLRIFGTPFPESSLYEALHYIRREIYYVVSYAGQNLADPPNVAGWPAYYLYPSYDNLWLDTATFPARNNAMLGIVYGSFTSPSNTVLPNNADLEYRVDLVAFTQLLQNPSDPELLMDQLAELFYVNPISEAVKDQLKQNYLLLGQSNDDYWSQAYTTYVADPNTTDMAAQLVPDILHWLIDDMKQAAESHLY
jgi:uncharacterized protein (DUF1800 family)